MIQIINGARDYRQYDRRVETREVHLFYCTKQRAESASPFLVHSAGSLCLLYFLSGSGRIEEQEVKKGDFVFLSKLSYVSLSAVEGSEWYCVMYEYSHGIPMLEGRSLRVLHGSMQMRELMERLYSAGAYRATMPGVREAMLLVILNEANQEVAAESKSIALYEAAIAWIEQNGTKGITVEEVAKAMGCTREHLNRVFRMAGGVRVGEWIAKVRIWEIEQLCCVSTLSPEEIAKRLDFASAELLCKYFRYHKGVSLHQYRQTNS